MGAEILKLFYVVTEWILFGYATFCVLYVILFSLAARFGRLKPYRESVHKRRIIVIIPAYREDKVIFDSVKSILKQSYLERSFRLLVVSDTMTKETNARLHKMDLELLMLESPADSKANAMINAVEYLNLKSEVYDIAVVLDSDNVVGENFLNDVNSAFEAGVFALQCHRTAKNLNSDIAVLDSISEEINNSIFRKGHVCLGLSSALAGSGMAFDYKWFCRHVLLLRTAGEDKEMELMLLKERIPVRYLDYTLVYDHKTDKADAFYGQRRRWIAAQFGSLKRGIKELPEAIACRNLDYIDKILQWMILPRVLLLGFIGFVAFVLTFISYTHSLKWWLILILLISSLTLSIPGFLWNVRSFNAVKKLPLIFILMFANLFRIKGVNKKYIHTEKG